MPAATDSSSQALQVNFIRSAICRRTGLQDEDDMPVLNLVTSKAARSSRILNSRTGRFRSNAYSNPLNSPSNRLF